MPKPRQKPGRLCAPPEHPWDRQPGETKAAWHCFVIYRDMGVERSQVKVAQKGANKWRGKIVPWSVKYNWVARSDAYDAWLDKQKRAADLAEILEMRRRHVQIAQNLQSAALLALQKILNEERRKVRKADGTEEPGRRVLRAKDVKDMLALGISEERKARGEPTEITDNKHSVNVESWSDMVGDVDTES